MEKKIKKIKKILFINIPRLTLKQLNEYNERSKYYWEVYPPLGIMYLSAAIKNETTDIDVKVLDMHIEGIKLSQANKKVDWFKMVKEAVEEFKPDLIHVVNPAVLGLGGIWLAKTNNIPGKFVSYTQFCLPIICFASINSSLAKLIIKYDCGVVIDLSLDYEKNWKMFSIFLRDLNKNREYLSRRQVLIFFSCEYCF